MSSYINSFKKLDKKEVFSWALFDFANSTYVVIILSFVFPVFFKEIIAGPKTGDFYWGLIIALSILLSGILSPIVGAIADADGRRKSKFIFFSLFCMLGTAALYFTGSHTLFFTCVLFIVINASFELAQILYDSFLKQIASQKNIGFISGLGWGIGYLGGIVALLVLSPFFAAGFLGNLESTYKLTFPLVALLFLVFSIPSFIFIKEQKSHLRIRFWLAVKQGYGRITSTFQAARKYKHLGIFLLAFFFLTDALVTVFSFMPLYAKTTLNLSMQEIMTAILIVQIIGFIATIFFGLISDKIGHKKVVIFTVALWCITTVLIAFTTTKISFYIALVLAGIAMGPSQAMARAWFANLVESDKRSEFFGFNGFSGKIAGLLGPLMFGIISVLTQNQRIAMLALLPFFVLSLILFLKVPAQHKLPG